MQNRAWQVKKKERERETRKSKKEGVETTTRRRNDGVCTPHESVWRVLGRQKKTKKKQLKRKTLNITGTLNRGNIVYIHFLMLHHICCMRCIIIIRLYIDIKRLTRVFSIVTLMIFCSTNTTTLIFLRWNSDCKFFFGVRVLNDNYESSLFEKNIISDAS